MAKRNTSGAHWRRARGAIHPSSNGMRWLFCARRSANGGRGQRARISDVTLAAWVREQEKHSVAADAAETEAERQEAIALRKRIKELETEIEILKRFTPTG